MQTLNFIEGSGRSSRRESIRSPTSRSKRSPSPLSKKNGLPARRQRSPSPTKKRCQRRQSVSPAKRKAKSKAIVKKPYIGDLDDANLPEYERDNVHLKFGYRIFYNRYWDCAFSIFKLHTETLNIWTHLLGALLFLALIPYLLIYLKPTSLHENESLLSRWTSEFDKGRFDFLQCDSEAFQFLETKGGAKCPYRTNELLADLLETDKLLGWHKLDEAKTKPHLGHTNLNYHASAFEKVDHYLHNAMALFTNPQSVLSKCIVCTDQAIRGLPGYLSSTMSEFFAEIDDCVPLGLSEQQGNNSDEAAGAHDHYCKVDKMRQFDRVLEGISTRVDAWVQNAKSDPSVQGLQALFTQEELFDQNHYVPRWPLLVHLSAAVIMLSCSAYYHTFCCQNLETATFLRCFDLTGINIMIAGSATPPFYYGFMCDETRFWGRFYLSILYFLCTLTSFLTYYYRNDRDKKMVLVIAYVSVGFSTAPGLLQMAYFTEAYLVKDYPIWPWLVGGIMYGLGGFLFALYIPERYFPHSRLVQTFFQSHTIFHVAVIVAALLHFWASLRTFHERQIFPCPEAGIVPTMAAHFSSGTDDL